MKFHPPLGLIGLLTCFGLFHLVMAFRFGPFQRENYHWWYVLTAVSGSSGVYLLVHTLFHFHDPHGYWGVPLVLLYIAALVQARTLEEKQKPRHKPAPV